MNQNPEIIEEENTPEGQVELREDEMARGARMLEQPADGSFIHGLQAFVAWVKSLLA